MLKLLFDSPPFSINSAYYKNGNRTVKCRNWGDHILDQLEQYEDDFEAFRKEFDPTKHSLKVEIVHLYPRDILFTVEGHISSRSMDLSNIEKLPIDLICDKRFFERGNNNLNINDKFSTRMTSDKALSPDNKYKLLFRISIIPLVKTVFDIDEFFK